jgi:ubiquinone biosynthesis UbiH/UbiF/VisC/COQ6 family hydroxylase
MFDVVIIGQSYIGKLTALNLCNALPDINICIIDKQTPKNKTEDRRATALSQSSVTLLNNLSLWDGILKDSSASISEIHIGMNTADTPLILQSQNLPLGYNILNQPFAQVLDEKLQRQSRIEYYHGHSIKNITVDTTCTTVTLENDTSITGRLIIGADGRFSGVRNLLTSTRTIHYHQTALAGTICHEHSHNQRAFEFFIPQGPLAFIPLLDPHTSTFVWSIKDTLLSSEDSLAQILSDLMQDRLGNIQHITPVQRYPLSAFIAKVRAGHRWVLLGDAANAIHPVAGQGMNLALRDITSLMSHLLQQVNLGLDIGSHTHLNRYAKSRQMDRHSLLGVTHASAKWLTTSYRPIRNVLNKGLNVFDRHSVLSHIAVNSASFGV